MENAKRFYCKNDLMSGEELILDEDLSHYVRNVLRKKSGEHLRVFNESDGEYEATVTSVSKKSVIIQIGNKIATNNESPIHIHLGQAISRGERMDFVVQKAVELGVSTITPLFTERCNVKLDKERSLSKIEHWQQIAISACEQSGRNRVPTINPPEDIKKWLANRNESLRFICHPGLENKKNLQTVSDTVALLIGAEGGFIEQEIFLAKQSHFESLNLGPRILRTETAAIVALTLIQFKWGDIQEVIA